MAKKKKLVPAIDRHEDEDSSTNEASSQGVTLMQGRDDENEVHQDSVEVVTTIQETKERREKRSKKAGAGSGSESGVAAPSTRRQGDGAAPGERPPASTKGMALPAIQETSQRSENEVFLSVPLDSSIIGHTRENAQEKIQRYVQSNFAPPNQDSSQLSGNLVSGSVPLGNDNTEDGELNAQEKIRRHEQPKKAPPALDTLIQESSQVIGHSVSESVPLRNTILDANLLNAQEKFRCHEQPNSGPLVQDSAYRAGKSVSFSVPLGKGSMDDTLLNAQKKVQCHEQPIFDSHDGIGIGRLVDEAGAPGAAGTLIAGQPLHEYPKLGQPGPSASVRQAWQGNSSRIFMNSGLGGRLEYVQPTSTRIAIKCSEGMPKAQVWGSTLLGQYVGFYPGFAAINNVMKTWGTSVKFRMEAGWMIFSFISDDERDRVLRGGPYFIFNKPLLLKHVPDKFAFNQKDVATMPLWVRITGLPNEFWTPTILARISSLLGKPLFMDHVTEERKRGSYARVLVEVNFAKRILREVSLDFDDGISLDCALLYENEPKYCRKCLQFGHKDEECAFNERPKDGGRPQPRRRQPARASQGPKAAEGNVTNSGTHNVVNVLSKSAGGEDMAGKGQSQPHFPENKQEKECPRPLIDEAEERRRAKGKGKVIEGVIYEEMARSSDEDSDEAGLESNEESTEIEEDLEAMAVQGSDGGADEPSLEASEDSDDEVFTPALSRAKRRIIRKLNASLEKQRKQATCEGQPTEGARRVTRLRIKHKDTGALDK